jgi:hypothetical protein
MILAMSNLRNFNLSLNWFLRQDGILQNLSDFWKVIFGSLSLRAIGLLIWLVWEVERICKFAETVFDRFLTFRQRFFGHFEF